MGVPSFYRWLCKKYPRVPIDAKEVVPLVVDGLEHPVDLTAPNPNGFEIDNLYLDMNGIIHPCCHPEGSEAPPTEEAMITKIFAYIDRIFAIVRPRKVLYMAIDGVAPRAKMNQQRQRRFRAAQERMEQEEVERTLREKFIAAGKPVPPPKPPVWDSNVITPGTPFMAKLSRALHHYVADRIAHVPAWQGLKVIFSDARVPGEGEHKIMAFVRNQRSQPGYNPNTRHCLYGMDADLIMLALSSHDPYFYIIREVVLEQHERKCFICGQTGHTAGECRGRTDANGAALADAYATHGPDAAAATEAVTEAINAARAANPQQQTGGVTVAIKKDGNQRPYQFLQIAILREYLEFDLRVPGLPWWSLERAIDDWIFLCFFVGNDFLPHMPSLEIREGAVDILVQLHRRLLPSLGDFLTHRGKVDFTRVDVVLSQLGAYEDAILQRRRRMEMSQEAARKRREADAGVAGVDRRSLTFAAPGAGGSAHSESGEGGVNREASLRAQAEGRLGNALAAQQAGGTGGAAVRAEGNDLALRARAGGDDALLSFNKKPATAAAAATSCNPASSNSVDAAAANAAAAKALRKSLKKGSAATAKTEDDAPANEVPATDETKAEAEAEEAVGQRKRTRTDVADVDAGAGAGAGADEEVSLLDVDAVAALDDSDDADSTTSVTHGADIAAAAAGDSDLDDEEEEEKEKDTEDAAAVKGKEKKKPKKAKKPKAGSAAAPAVAGAGKEADKESAPQFAKTLAALVKDMGLGDGSADTTQLGVAGYRDRYYRQKMGLDRNNAKHAGSLATMFHSYAEGLAWVFEYYFEVRRHISCKTK